MARPPCGAALHLRGLTHHGTLLHPGTQAKGTSMDRQRIGLLLTSSALVMYAVLLPLLRVGQPITFAAHFVAGAMLGLGATMIVAGRIARRRAARRRG